jgi:hypothetical protein
MAMPAVSAVTEPNVAIVRFANDVALVGSMFVHVPSSVLMVASTVTTATVATFAMMAAAMVPTTVVTPAMPATVAFGIRRRNDSNSECRNNGKHERNLFQHFVLLLRLEVMHCRNWLVNAR